MFNEGLLYSDKDKTKLNVHFFKTKIIPNLNISASIS